MSAANHVLRRPTGTTAVVAAAIVVVASKLGLDLSAEEAGILVGALAALVSLVSPLPEPEVPEVQED